LVSDGRRQRTGRVEAGLGSARMRETRSESSLVVGEDSGVLGDEDADVPENQLWPKTRGCWPDAM
jgi:hypothetical protein